MKPRILCLSLSLTLCPLTLAALPDLFRIEYNAPTNHSDEGLCIAADGRGAYAAGTAYSSVTGTYDAHLVAVRPNGSVRWVHQDRVVDESEAPSQIEVDTFGNVLMLSFARNPQGAFLRLAKFTPNGARLWARDVSRGTSIVNREEAALAIDAVGNAYIGNARNRDMLVAKIGPDSTVLWERTIANSQDWEEVTSLAVDPNGGVVATGVAGSIQGGYRTVKYDTAGNLMWTNNNSGQIGNTLGPAFVKPLSTGEWVVLCTPESTFGVPQYRLIKLDAAGNLLWQKDYKPSPMSDCEATGLVVDKKDNIIAAGFRVGGGVDTVVVKYDLNGNFLWEANYTPSSGISGDVVVDGAGNITLCGFLNAGSSTGLVVRYDSAGAQVWSVTKAKDNYARVDVDGKGNVFAVGGVFNAATNQDFVIAGFSWIGSKVPVKAP